MSFWWKNFVFGTFGNDVLSGTDKADWVFAFGGNDEISTGAGKDRVFAGRGNDLIDAGADDDTVFAGAGDDTVVGGEGDDRVFGGRGFDTVTYLGQVSDYDITTKGKWAAKTTVASKDDALGDAGRDTLFGVEALYFEADDYTLFLDGTNNAVLAGDDAVATAENDPLLISGAALLANDQEFDGDTIEIVAVDATSAAGASLSFVDGDITYDPGALFDALAEGETASDSFIYTVDDGKGGSDVATVTVTITGVNDGPVLVAAEAVSVEENTTAVAAGISASDVDSTDLTFSLSGVDAGLFDIDAVTGALSFKVAPDFEAAGDAGGDNVYDVTVTVTDDLGASDSKDVAVTVTDVDEMPDVVARINEFHYDNSGSDVGEFIEIRVEKGGDVSALSLTLYNGSNGTPYNDLQVDGQPMTSDDAFDYYVIALPPNGLQNGAPDGIALANGGTVVEFLSYEGVLTAVGGVADGLTSEDIGVAEGGDTPVGFSLQRNDDGTWRVPEEATQGAANVAAPAEPPRLNEFHYDNEGSDTGEFIEVRVAKGADVSALEVTLYNGSNGSVYNTLAVGDGVLSSDDDYDYYVIDLPSNGLQNGAPDGIALSDDGALVEFLSYEGAFAGVGGPADGVTSTDIGVQEVSSTPVGFSLQRNDDGTWREPEAETKGGANEAGVSIADARLNEFHYDNAGGDVGEFIEVRVAAGQDASGLVVELYNGNGGSVYNALSVTSGSKTSDADFDYYVIDLPANGLQNGSPDGLALSDNGTLIEFLSYEGTLTGFGGAADGVTSTDIGQVEGGTTSVGQSLQRNADGTWRAPEAQTKGADNDAVVEPPEPKLISEIQGTGSASLLEGMTVAVSAVVTHVVSNGYYLQEELADYDADPLSSEGIFVFSPSGAGVMLGDLVEVSGEVDEFFGMTQITNVTSEVIVASNVEVPPATEIALSPDVAPNFEAVEGMLISVSSGTPDPLTVIENFNLARFGEIAIGAGIQTQPTQLFDAQTEAAEIEALQDANANSRLILDDGLGTSNPDEFLYLPGGPGDNGNGYLDAGDDFSDGGSTLRLGTELTADAVGVLNFSFGDYKLVVTEQIQIDEATNSGAREATPEDVGGDLQVASVNVLNYFSTLDNGSGGSGPNGLRPRGADDEPELVRQTEKLVASITGTGAEVFALQEIENGGFADGSAIDTLTDALNAEALLTVSGAAYAFVDPTGDVGDGFLGTDAITTGIIYDANAVTLIQSDVLVYDEPSAALTFALAEVLNAVVASGDQVGDFQRNRPSVAATFEDNVTGEQFTVVSSHYKSKGDSNLQDLVDAAQEYLDAGGTDITQADIDALKADPNFDQGDGQGFWNQVRLDAATELADWIETDYAGTGVSDYLLLGDMNAYAKEDPVQYLDEDAALVDLIDSFVGQDDAYSFVFDGQRGTLDQAFASGGLADNVTGLTEWHINADEPGLINYDQSFNNLLFYNDGVFAASDHDPLILGLDLTDPLVVS